MVRSGTASNPDPNAEIPICFTHDVKAPDYHETWIEDMDIYHNQNAKIPLALRMPPPERPITN